MSQVFICLNLNGRLSFLLYILSAKDTDVIGLDFALNISSAQLRALLLLLISLWDFNVSLIFKLQVFQIPSMVTLSIAATRIHRGLVDYHHASRGGKRYGITLFHSSRCSLWLMSYVARENPTASES
jgi:hypothetical protein